jgi:hypothetical protein
VRKLVATVAVLCGLGLVALPFALSLFERAPAGERVTNRFRSTLSADGLHSLAVNFSTMGAMVDQFIHRASPQLARELHMTGGEYNAFVDRRFPAVAAGVKGIPPLVAFVTPVAAQLEALHPQFESVDSLPFLGLPLSTVPWILLAIGAALIGLGVVLGCTRRRAPLMFAAALGVAMIVLPLALSYPRKASDATKVAAVGKVALSPQAAAGAQTANRLIDRTVTQVKTEMIPALAQRLHVSTAAFEHSVATRYPAVAKGLAAWPTIKPGAVELVRRQVASVSDATELNGLDFTPLPWFIMGPGIALLLTAGIALTLRSRPEPARTAELGLRTTGARTSRPPAAVKR